MSTSSWLGCMRSGTMDTCRCCTRLNGVPGWVQLAALVGVKAPEAALLAALLLPDLEAAIADTAAGALCCLWG